jgi:hypothetical protein
MYDQYKDLTVANIREHLTTLFYPKEPTRQMTIHFFSEQARQAFDDACRQYMAHEIRRQKRHPRKRKTPR